MATKVNSKSNGCTSYLVFKVVTVYQGHYHQFASENSETRLKNVPQYNGVNITVWLVARWHDVIMSSR